MLTLGERKWTIDLAETLDLPGELLPGSGRVTVSGGRHAVIEGHRGILEYREERLTVALARGRVSLCGSGLRLKALSRDQLYVEGSIDTLEWG